MERFFFWVTERDQRGSDYFYYNKIASEWSRVTVPQQQSLLHFGANLNDLLDETYEEICFQIPTKIVLLIMIFLQDNSECPAWKDYGNTNYHRYVQNIFQNEYIHWIGASLFLLLSCVFFLSIYYIVEAYDHERFVPPREFELQRMRYISWIKTKLHHYVFEWLKPFAWLPMNYFFLL